MMITVLAVEDQNHTHTSLHLDMPSVLRTLRDNYDQDGQWVDTSDDDIIQTLIDKEGLVIYITEHEVPEAIPWDLRLSFTPDAIREHFEGDDPDPTEGLTDEQLADVGRHALTDEGLYDAFHESLTWALDSDETKENG